MSNDHAGGMVSSWKDHDHHLSHRRKRSLFGEIVVALRPGGVFANLEVVQSRLLSCTRSSTAGSSGLVAILKTSWRRWGRNCSGCALRD